MTERMRWLVFATAGVVLAAAFTSGYGQNVPPGAHGFTAFRSTHAPRKAGEKPAQTIQTSASLTRDTQAVTLATQALKALTGGLAIADVTVQGNSNFITGSDQETGTATLQARAGYQSRVILSLNGGQRTEVRNGSGALPQVKSSGPDAVWHLAPLHNCWVDLTWFFPALTLQSALKDSQIAFAYLGQDIKADTSVQHIQISRVVPGQGTAATSLIKQLSQIDIYLDASSSLPVALDFNVHSPKDAVRNIPVEVQFSGWHSLGGVQAPSRIQKFLQNSLSLDLNVSTVSINTGIPQTDFQI